MFKSSPSRGLTSCGRQMSSHDQSAWLVQELRLDTIFELCELSFYNLADTLK